MTRPIISQRLLLTILIAIAAIVVACGSDSDSALGFVPERGSTQNAAAQTAVPAATAASVVPQSQAPQAPVPSSRDVDFSDSVLAGDGEEASISGVDAQNISFDTQIASAASNRIIVRTVDIDIIVPNIARAISQVSDLAGRLGGWVVSSEQLESHRARVSIRVPSGSVEEALTGVKGVSVEVESERSSSRDFTEEFTDINSQIETMRLTLGSLRVLFIRADKIEDIIVIQKEITRIQSEMDALQARSNFLSETSSFSLINVDMSTAPLFIRTDAGTDQAPAVGGVARFRAQFDAPEGIEDFVITWDFGDGTPEVRITRVIEIEESNVLISAPVTHVYLGDIESPYVVRARVEGTGPAGIAEGEDKLVATVSQIPIIEVYAGEQQVSVEAGSEIDFRGSFTRPEGLTNLTYSWSFGDGFSQEEVILPAGVTAATASHKYANYRPAPFTAVLTVHGESPAGPAEATGQVVVTVMDPSATDLTELRLASTAKGAGRAFLAVGAVIINLMIISLVFVPFFLVAGAVWWFFFRIRGGRRPDPTSTGQVPYTTPDLSE